MCRARQTRTLPDMSSLVCRAKVGARPDRHGHTPLGVSGCPVCPSPRHCRVGGDYQRSRASRRSRVGPSPSGRVGGSAEPRHFPLPRNFQTGNPGLWLREFLVAAEDVHNFNYCFPSFIQKFFDRWPVIKLSTMSNFVPAFVQPFDRSVPKLLEAWMFLIFFHDRKKYSGELPVDTVRVLQQSVYEINWQALCSHQLIPDRKVRHQLHTDCCAQRCRGIFATLVEADGLLPVPRDLLVVLCFRVWLLPVFLFQFSSCHQTSSVSMAASRSK